MLDGTALESLSPAALKPQTPGKAQSPGESGANPRANRDRKGGRNFLAEQAGSPRRLEEGPNFSNLPPGLEDTTLGDSPPLSMSKEQTDFINMLKTQGAPDFNNSTPHPAVVDSNKSSVKSDSLNSDGGLSGSQNVTDSVKSQVGTGVKETLKVVWDKVKEIAKKVWYYGTGSFLWDKFPGSTPPPKPA